MPEPGSLSEVADPNHHPRERVPRQGHRRAEHESAQRPPELSAPAGRERDDGHVDQDEVRSGKHQQPGQHADAQPPAEQRRPDEPHHEGDREVGLQADRRVEQRARQQDSHAEPRHEPTVQPGVASEGVQPEGSGSGRRDEQDTGRKNRRVQQEGQRGEQPHIQRTRRGIRRDPFDQRPLFMQGEVPGVGQRNVAVVRQGGAGHQEQQSTADRADRRQPCGGPLASRLPSATGAERPGLVTCPAIPPPTATGRSVTARDSTTDSDLPGAARGSSRGMAVMCSTRRSRRWQDRFAFDPRTETCS